MARREIIKELTISIKTPSESLSSFKKALKKARKGRLKGDHFEIAFDTEKDFDLFVKNLATLSPILGRKK